MMSAKQRQAWLECARHEAETGQSTVIAQFRMTEYFGTEEELNLRHKVQRAVGDELEKLGIGHCDGGQGGGGLAEVFFYVHTSKLKLGLETIKRVIEEMGLLKAAKIVWPDNTDMVHRIFFPENCTIPFSFFPPETEGPLRWQHRP